MLSRRLLPRTARIFPLLLWTASLHLAAQASGDKPAAPQSPASDSTITMKVATRLVSLEVVARDHQGRPVPDLTAKDLQVYEEILPGKDQKRQSIAAFKAVNWTELRAASAAAPELPPGVYSNLVNKQKAQMPPTVLLFDGINTDLQSQMQVHRQMMKILGALPTDMQVAVFLMGDRLKLLQSFTNDPKLLRDAASKALALGKNAPDQDPIDDPDAQSAKLEDLPAGVMPAGALATLEGFEQRLYTFQLSVRIRKTLDALRGIARYLDGYPGRKNIIWISSAFPLQLSPVDELSGNNFGDLHFFQSDMQEVSAALMDGRIAIYPVDAGGVRTESMFDPSTRLRNPGYGPSVAAGARREGMMRQQAQQVMRDVADDTGGRVCIGDNDFGDCVKKAMDDASTYYELAYYPNAGEWHGEYHRIVIKTARPGVHLSYREGYYGKPLAMTSSTPETAQGADPILQRTACEDPLPATAILVMAKAIPADKPGDVKYFLAIDAQRLTFAREAGARSLDVVLAACMFDKTGQPLQYMQRGGRARLSDQEFATASHGLTQMMEFTPKAGIARVRLLVRDSMSGRLGSVDVPYSETSVAAPAAETPPSK